MSYIVISKETGKAVCELFNEKNANMVNRKKYTVMTAYEYLVKLNGELK